MKDSDIFYLLNTHPSISVQRDIAGHVEVKDKGSKGELDEIVLNAHLIDTKPLPSLSIKVRRRPQPKQIGDIGIPDAVLTLQPVGSDKARVSTEGDLEVTGLEQAEVLQIARQGYEILEAFLNSTPDSKVGIKVRRHHSNRVSDEMDGGKLSITRAYDAASWYGKELGDVIVATGSVTGADLPHRERRWELEKQILNRVLIE